MHIKKQIFYHIHIKNSNSAIWIPGNSINWVNKTTNYYNQFYNWHEITIEDVDGKGPIYLCAALKELAGKDAIFQHSMVSRYFELMAAAIAEQCKFIRETLFEEVRGNYFPHLPSRKSCIWLCNKNAVSYWWNILGKKEKIIFKFEVTGAAHIADQKYLDTDTKAHDKLRAQAFNYWTGAIDETSIEAEILFEGIIDVVAQYTNIDEFIINET